VLDTSAMHSVKIALVGGLALVAIAVGLTLAGSPTTVIATNGIGEEREVASTTRSARACQSGETAPAGTTAIRLALLAEIGPRVTVTVTAAGTAVTHGVRGAGWAGASVTVPLARVARRIPDATVCFALGRPLEAVTIAGRKTPAAIAATAGSQALPGRVTIEYLRRGSASWLSLVPTIAQRMGVGHAWPGAWIVFVLLIGMASILGLLCRLCLSARQSTRAAWMCMLVAVINAACWSFITPPFEVPDEPDHFAYVQQLAETGDLPRSAEKQFSQEELVALRDLDQAQIRQQPQSQSIFSSAQQQRLEHDLETPLARTDDGDAGDATSEPPLFYALQALPYGLGSGGTLLERLELMRLLSAMMAGITALFAFLFVREALPEARWAWTVGGLGVALAPLLGFMSGSVNPDAMLYAVSAALLYCLARAFRRELRLRSSCAIGAVIAVGLLTKLNFVGLLPGAGLALILLARRAARSHGRIAYGWLACAVALGAVPAVLYAILNALLSHHPLGIVSGASATASHHGSLSGEISYIWQLYLPRLPGMAHDFPGYLTAREIWLDGYIGLYGWFDTVFPGWVYDLALVPVGLIVLGCLRALLASRPALRERLAELLVYAAIGLGLIVLVGADSYLKFPHTAAEYGQTRYLLPLLPLLGAVLALAARGAGRRWGPAAGVSLVVLLFAHDLFSQLQTIARYYG
jgi:Predicted membrane protein (DUF2142)